MSTANPTRAEIEALIDTLDRAERQQPNIWRKPLLDLQERLSKAQRIRRWVGAPLLGLALLAPSQFATENWITWLGFSWVLGAVALMIMQVVLEHAFPILDREARIQALGGYFQPWRDEDELEPRETEHGAA